MVYTTFQDWPDNTAIYGSIIYYMSGCDFRCAGCHNVELQEHKRMALPYITEDSPIRNVILSGGDPFSSGNIQATAYFVKFLLYNDFNVMIYTGNTSEQYDRIKQTFPFFTDLSYVKCGQYIKELSQESGHRSGKFYLASKNQRLIRGDGTLLSDSNGVFTYKE